MSAFVSLSENELKKIVISKAGTPIAACAEIEIDRRNAKKEFIRRDLVRWIALLISIISLCLGIRNALITNRIVRKDTNRMTQQSNPVVNSGEVSEE